VFATFHPIRPIGPSGITPAAPNEVQPPPGAAPGGRFADELSSVAAERSIQLSGHAARRIEQRGIALDGPRLERLTRAFDQLAARGGRSSLVWLDQVAYVVHVPSHTVVTAVAPTDTKESVFTHIDSVAIA